MKPAMRWTPKLGEAAAEVFFAAVEHTVWHRYGEHTIYDKRGRVRIESLGATRSLAAAAEACADSGLPTQKWWGLLAENLDGLLDLPGPPPIDNDKRLAEWERAKELLRPLAVAPERLSETNRPVAQWLPGAAPVAVVVATGDKTTLFDKSMLERWGVHPGEALWAAKANLFSSGRLEMADVPRTRGLYYELTAPRTRGRFGCLSNRPPIASGHLAYFDRYIDHPGSGAAVAIPAEDTVLIRPIEPDRPADSAFDILAMAADAAERHDRSDRPVANNVFWYRPDTPTAELCRPVSTGTKITAPKGLCELIGWHKGHIERHQQLAPTMAAAGSPRGPSTLDCGI